HLTVDCRTSQAHTRAVGSAPILLGPVPRRVEPRAVSVFIATRANASVTVHSYEGLVDAAAPPVERASHTSQTIRFAKTFHATVVTVELPDVASLQPDHLYSVALAGGAAQSLKDLLSDELRVGTAVELTSPEPQPSESGRENQAQRKARPRLRR